MLITAEHSPQKALTKVHYQLKRAAVDKKHNFRFFSIATVNEQTAIPQNRMVVLRSFSEDWQFEFYTDQRSSKIDDIKNQPVISALFWDSSKQVQVRIEADAAAHNQDKIARNRWERVQGEAQKAYTSLIAPGTPIDDPEQAHKWPDEFVDDYFTVIKCMAFKIKILQLPGMKHLALEFGRYKKESDWKGKWTAP